MLLSRYMNISPVNIIPITQARSKLGDLTKSLSGENYIILTKGGSPKAALVDIKYLAQLQNDVSKIFRKTFIDPALLPLTRIFTDKEISGWKDEDQL